MKKRLLFGLVLLALLLSVAAPVLAVQPGQDLTALAQYFPFDTSAFVSFRTDDATIAELDAVVAGVLAKLPEGLVPPDSSLTSALDQIAREADVNDFSDIRAWLGDTAAAGRIMEDDPNTPGIEGSLFAAQITDRAAAETFWKAILDRSGGQDYTVEEGDAFTLYAIESNPATDAGLLFTDDVMLLGVANLPQLLLTRDAKLAQNDTFRQTLELLPANEYSAVVYVDAPALAVADDGASGLTSSMLGQQAIGFTLLDERTLVADVASKLGNLSTLENLGVSLPELQPVNPAFAANIPADVSMFAHASNLKGFYDAIIEFERFQVSQWTDGSKPEDVDRKWGQLAFAVRGLTGLDLQEDILSWMTGDFALFASVDNDAIQLAMQRAVEGSPFVLETVPVEFGFVVEATDADKAQALAEGVGKALTQLTTQNEDVTVSQEQIGGADVTVLTTQVEISFETQAPLDVVIGANDAVFMIATRDAATAILEGEPGLSGVPDFAEASNYLVDNPTSLWYLDSNGFGSLSTVVGLAMVGPAIGQVFESVVADLESGAVSTLTPEEIQQRQDEAERQRQAQMQQAQGLITFLNSFMTSATISTTTVDGGSLARFVLTLAE